jgi:hypothetical protein
MDNQMSWRSELDSLKQGASAQTRRATADARKILDALGGSLPDVWARTVAEEHLNNFYAAARNLGIDPRPPSVTTHGWQLSLSRVATTDSGYMWHLSASFHPRGRSSTVKDWKMLGHLVMHLGAPKDPMIMPEDPTQVVHWQWMEAA